MDWSFICKGSDKCVVVKQLISDTSGGGDKLWGWPSELHGLLEVSGVANNLECISSYNESLWLDDAELGGVG